MLDFARFAPPESALGKALRWPLRLLPRNCVVPILSGPLRGWRWVVGVGLHGCWLGTYELKKQRAFAANVQAGHVVYDIGANVGFYTLLAARRVGARGRVFAFEPSPGNLLHLRRHLELNPCSRTVVFDCALAEQIGEASFDDAGCYTGRLAANGRLKVKVETLDGLLETKTIAPADVVKVDVEGAELAVLKGGENFFRRIRPAIFLATHNRRLHGDCCALLREWGYDLRPLSGRDRLENADEILARRTGPVANPVCVEA
jgi:FkbM family methyltransferase